MEIIQLPPPRTGVFPAIRRLWDARSELHGLPTLQQVRAMARDGGVRPCLHPFDPGASNVPEKVRQSSERHRGRRALLYTRRWKGSWRDVAVLPDGTHLGLLR